jgi:pimeloyl-ACP methyl ester carboxylesterase
MRSHCTALAAVLLAAAATSAQAPAAPEPATGETEFTVAVRGTPVGRERVTLSRGSSGWIITSTGTLGPPIDLRITRFELKYTTDWQPLELKLDAMLRNSPIALSSSFGMTTAINEVTQNGVTGSKEDQISARTTVLPDNFFAGYEALAARLSTTEVNGELPLYLVPRGEIKVKVREITPQTLSGPTGSIPVRRFDVTFSYAPNPVEGSITIDNRARLVRVDVPSAGLQVIREDAASVAVRRESVHNPTDSPVSIPANGFNIAGTVTVPPTVAGRLRYPGIVLVAGSGETDRDEIVAGIPIFAELARQLAESGHVVLRYDKRGIGQSGGRIENATLPDYADDTLAAVRWLRRRKDVDDRRLVVAGHSEGSAVALIAAGRQKDIDGVVSIAGPGTTGAELILEQQRRVLDRMSLSPEQKQAKIDLQKKIQDAVISGQGLDDLPKDVRSQADTPWFRSLLTYDPAQVLAKVRQPLLIVQGELDSEVPPAQADRLAEHARARKKAPPIEVVHIPGINHLLVPATSGDPSEYPSLREHTVSPRVAQAIAEWIKKLP